MIEGYKNKGCPVIEHDDLWRAMHYLPSKEVVLKEGNGETHIVYLDGDEDKAVIFDWDKKAEGWQLRNRLVFGVNFGIVDYNCAKCAKDTEHYINKVCTKRKCKVCGEITDLDI